MSDKERSLAEQLAELPVAVQDKFLLMAQGAAVAVECAREEQKETGDDLSTACGGPPPLSGEADDGGAA